MRVVIYAWVGNVGHGIVLCKMKRFPHRGRRPLSYEEEISYQRAIALVSPDLGRNGSYRIASRKYCAGWIVYRGDRAEYDPQRRGFFGRCSTSCPFHLLVSYDASANWS